jgi:hypothetical protein
MKKILSILLVMNLLFLAACEDTPKRVLINIKYYRTKYKIVYALYRSSENSGRVTLMTIVPESEVSKIPDGRITDVDELE